MKNYKIVASDLDGTLLNTNSQVSSENLRAIDALYAKGVQFVPASGRAFSEMPEAIRNNSAIRYVIYSNGAVLYDKQSGQRIMNCLDNQMARSILDVLYQYDCHIAYRQNGICHVDAMQKSEALFAHHNVCEAHQDVVMQYATAVDDFKTLSYGADHVEAFAAFFHRYEDKVACKSYFSQFAHLRVAEVSEHNIEIMNVRAGKGNALHALADLLGIEYADTIAVGDSDNDASMLSAAGLSLAVSNATPVIQAMADEMICSNDAHAIAHILANYF